MGEQTSNSQALNPAQLGKDLLVSGILAAAIFGTTLGFKTETAVGGLSLEYKMGLAATSVAVVVIGRLILWLTLWRKGPGTGSASAVADGVFNRIVSIFSGRTKMLGIAALTFALVFPFLPFADRYLIDLAILILTYIMLGWGLNIVVGLAGLLDLGYVAFYAIGAYSYALLAQYFCVSFWMCLPLAGILAAFASCFSIGISSRAAPMACLASQDPPSLACLLNGGRVILRMCLALIIHQYIASFSFIS
jgi:branched-chain amino acid transport system permease protein